MRPPPSRGHEDWSSIVFEAEQRLKVAREGIVDSRTVQTFASFCVDAYKPAAKLALREKTWNIRRDQIENLLVCFGTVKLTKLSEVLIEDFKRHRRKTVGPVTVNTELNVLSAKVARKAEGTFGVLLSISGFVANINDTATRGTRLNCVGVGSAELMTVLEGRPTFGDVVRRARAQASTRATFHTT